MYVIFKQNTLLRVILHTTLCFSILVLPPRFALACESSFDKSPIAPVTLRHLSVATSPSGFKIIFVPSNINKIYGVSKYAVRTTDNVHQEVDKHVNDVWKYHQSRLGEKLMCLLLGSAFICAGAFVLYVAPTAASIRMATFLALMTAAFSMLPFLEETPTNGNQTEFKNFIKALSSTQRVATENTDDEYNLLTSTPWADASAYTDMDPARKYDNASPIVVAMQEGAIKNLAQYLAKEGWAVQEDLSYSISPEDAQEHHPIRFSNGSISGAALRLIYDSAQDIYEGS